MSEPETQPVKLMPGLYVQGDTFHFDTAEYCAFAGWPITPENESRASALISEALKKKWPETTINERHAAENESVPRPAVDAALHCPVCNRPAQLSQYSANHLPSLGDAVACFNCATVLISDGATLRPATDGELVEIRKSPAWPSIEQTIRRHQEVAAEIAKGPRAAAEAHSRMVSENLHNWRRLPRLQAFIAAEKWLERMAIAMHGLKSNPREGNAAFAEVLQTDIVRVRAFRDHMQRLIAQAHAAAAERPSVFSRLPEHVQTFIAEAPCILFDNHPDKAVHFVLFKQAGNFSPVAPISFAPGTCRQHIAQEIRTHCAEARPIALVMITEATLVKVGMAEAREPLSLGAVHINTPPSSLAGAQRVEVFHLQVETAAGMEAWHWPIQVDESGNRTLGQRHDFHLSPGSPFANLLPKQPTTVN